MEESCLLFWEAHAERSGLVDLDLDRVRDLVAVLGVVDGDVAEVDVWEFGVI